MTSTPDIAVASGASGNDTFYRNHGAAAIMRVAHFPDEILAFIQLEILAVLEAVSRYGCTTLVELGCYDGRSLEIARAAQIDYLGIDVNQEAVGLLRRRIIDEGLDGRARAVVGDAMRCEEWIEQITSLRPLQLLPFNLLGSFADPELLLRSISRVGGLAVLSVFGAAPKATAIRQAYYEACGISPLERVPGPYGGVAFRSGQDFHSLSFDRKALAELIGRCGITVLSETTNTIGHCLTVYLG